ncbi:tyrosine-type recombinase/integrase [Paenibacillus sp. LPE1-1-1.1]|uniref:tyrosine-type recombinase/integrase n=1 Tax=Paenibacillus sp. LPE1-1-1.1 TaxID=3135230 RepID=UPI00343CC687
MFILMNSAYIEAWEKYSDIAKRTKDNYRSVYKKLDNYLCHCNYTGDLNFDRFFHIKEDDSWEPIDKNFIDDFLDHLAAEGATKATMSHSISALTHLFNFLRNMKMINKNPITYYSNPYSNNIILDRALSPDEVDRLLRTSLKIDQFLRKSYLLILLLVNTGLRNQELRELTIAQIDFERKLIYVDRGQKTSKNTVHLTNHLIDELKRYMQHPFNEKRFRESNTHLFVRKNGQKLKKAEHVNDWLNEIAIASEVRHITAHCLRHTMAQSLQAAGVDLRYIQLQLRHKSIETTVRYLGTFNMASLID